MLHTRASIYEENVVSHKINKIADTRIRNGGTRYERIAQMQVWTSYCSISATELTNQEEARGLTLESKQSRNRIVNAGLDAAKNQTRGFPLTKLANLVTTGNFQDDLEKLSNVDWIIEAMIEKLDIRAIYFSRVRRFGKPNDKFASNTSGIPIKAMAEEMSNDFPQAFPWNALFQPATILKLLEMIPTARRYPKSSDGR